MAQHPTDALKDAFRRGADRVVQASLARWLKANLMAIGVSPSEFAAQGLIELGNGDELTVPAENLAAVIITLTEYYRYKRNRHLAMQPLGDFIPTSKQLAIEGYREALLQHLQVDGDDVNAEHILCLYHASTSDSWFDALVADDDELLENSMLDVLCDVAVALGSRPSHVRNKEGITALLEKWGESWHEVVYGLELPPSILD